MCLFSTGDIIADSSAVVNTFFKNILVFFNKIIPRNLWKLSGDVGS